MTEKCWWESPHERGRRAEHRHHSLFKHSVTARKSRVRKGRPSPLDESLVAFASGPSNTAPIPSVLRAINGPQSFRNEVDPSALTLID